MLFQGIQLEYDFKIAALNNIDVIDSDIENDYLTVPWWEKVWMQYGPEFGNPEGNILVVKRTLYGLKSLGAEFRSFVAETLDNIQYQSLYEGGYQAYRWNILRLYSVLGWWYYLY